MAAVDLPARDAEAVTRLLLHEPERGNRSWVPPVENMPGVRHALLWIVARTGVFAPLAVRRYR